MLKKIDRNSLLFFGGLLAVFVIVQVLISLNVLNAFWNTILRQGAVMAIVALGLNLIYGFNGQFSLGQWGFYAIGAYAAADVTFRWTNQSSTSGLTVLLFAVLFVGAAIILLYNLLSKLPGLDPISSFAVYLIATVGLVIAAVQVGKVLVNPLNAALLALPVDISNTIVFVLAVIIGGLLAAEVSFLFGLPVLTLGSDYFGIATLGFTIIVKVLLDNSDVMLGFEEMKGARGMIGIPKLTSWFWVMLFLTLTIIVVRNLLHSSSGRAIVAVREDEIAAKAMGIDVSHYKTLTFVLGSLFAGLAGGLYAHINGFLHPNSFNFIKSFDPMIVVVFGGLGSVTGTIFASFAFYIVLEGLLRQVLPSGFETWRYVVYPLLLLIMMLLKPSGLFGNIELPYLRQVIPALRKKDEPATINPAATVEEVSS